jgi:hypothetical protein
LKGNHTLSFGGTFRRTWWWFRRNDLLAGPLTALTATVDDASFVTIPGAVPSPDLFRGRDGQLSARQ